MRIVVFLAVVQFLKFLKVVVVDFLAVKQFLK